MPLVIDDVMEVVAVTAIFPQLTFLCYPPTHVVVSQPMVAAG
jgi:hypothetical protein